MFYILTGQMESSSLTGPQFRLGSQPVNRTERVKWMSEFLRVKDITKKYGNFTALDHVNLSIDKGEFVCLLGPSGCGKTTLLRIIAGLEKPTEGQVFLNGMDATHMHPSQRNFGIVFQSYALFPNMTVKDNIAFGLKNKHMKKDEINQKVEQALKQVNLLDQIKKYPAQLSGGQQQRIALARALVLSPDFLLLDEPLSALDAKVRQKVRKEIRSLQEELGITTIMVTHDQEEALTMADRIVVMNNACVRQTGTPVEVYERPNCPFVADFIGSINFFHTDVSKDVIPTENGTESLKDELVGTRYRIKACRPENIELVENGTPNSFKVTVHDVEFHGYGYRLALELRSSNEKIFSNEYISIDLTTEEFKRLQIEKNAKVSVRFKKGGLLYYNLNADLEARQ